MLPLSASTLDHLSLSRRSNPPLRTLHTSTMPRSSRQQHNDMLVDSDDENVAPSQTQTDDDDVKVMMFSSQAPEMSQNIHIARATEKSKFLELNEPVREKHIVDLTRLILGKALAGDSIDRLKCAKEAGVAEAKVSNALFEEVNERLHNCFAFELKRVPAWMEKQKLLPKAYKDRYYLINSINDESGAHSKAIHNVHTSSSVEKGLLMVVLALSYCKGEPLADGSRWILDTDLYKLLHKLDDTLPAEPLGVKRTSRAATTTSDNDTPDVDALMEVFVQRDYLLREKTNETLANLHQQATDTSFFYAMGPRATMEIGRKQIIYFCAEVLGEDPDPTMLKELEDHPEEE